MHKSLVIIGAGFAGTKTAQGIRACSAHPLGPDTRRQKNCISFNPLLPEVVGASILPGHAIAPHRQMIHCSHVCMAQVTHIDSVERVAHYLGEGVGTFQYDQLYLNTRAVLVTDRAVHRASGEIIEGGTVVCTIGTQSNPLIEELPAEKSRGRLVVNADLSVCGVAGVWAAGDCAAVINVCDGKLAPPTAQFAAAQARQLAANIVAHRAGKPTRAFHYQPKGQLSSIGHNNAVPEIFGFKLSGFIAGLIWRGVYLLRVPTFARKRRQFLEWNWAMFFPPDIFHLGYRRTQWCAPQEAPGAVGAEPEKSRFQSSPDAPPNIGAIIWRRCVSVARRATNRRC
jgi:NADH dehydrogenase FAD-containing subunit